MRIHLCAGAALILAALSLPLTGAAQKFQQPTKEELQMTSDPKAPGAPAVFLYRQEETDNHSHYVGEYARIKVLTEKGKEYATVEVPYIPGFSDPPIIEGRTIHSDGTVIPLVGKASDLLVVKTNSYHVKVSVFNLPSVEVGSILEYKWSLPLTGGKVSGTLDEDVEVISSMLAGSIPEWDVQLPIYVHKEHFYWNPYSDLETGPGGGGITHLINGEVASYLLTVQRLPAGATATRSPKGDFTLDIQDVPAFVHEADAPPDEAMRYSVHFYWSIYNSPDVFWQKEIERWSKKVNDFASQSSAIRDTANQITAGAATPEARARKLYDAVQSLDNTDFTRAKTEEERKALHLKQEVKKAQDVWSEKSGSGNDIAALYLALARAAGLNADGLQVADRNRRIFDPSYLSLDQLDSLLVVLHIDGKDIYLDPGEKLCPFGQLQWTHSPELVAAMEEETMTGTPGTKVFNEAPVFMKESLTFPYSYGMDFIVQLMQKGGKEKAFAGVLKNPPHTTRQIMQPETYLSGETIAPMRVPDFKHDFKDYQKFDIGGMGDPYVAILIEQYADKKLSKKMYPEWRGGYYYAAKAESECQCALWGCSTSRAGQVPMLPPNLPASMRLLSSSGTKSGRTGESRCSARQAPRRGFRQRTRAHAVEWPPHLDHRRRYGRDRGTRRYRAGQRKPGRRHHRSS